MMIDEAMEAKGFSFEPTEKGWKKNKIFIPEEMLNDNPYPEFIDKVTYFADMDYEFVSDPNKTMLGLSNGLVTLDFMKTLDLPLEELKKEVVKMYPSLN